MRVGLFGDRLARGARTTGVGVYIASLSRALAATDEHEFVLFSTPERDVVPHGFYGRMSLETLPWPRRPVQAAWSLVGRPLVNEVAGPLDLVHVLVPSVPVPTQRPLVVTIFDVMPLRFPEFFRRSDRVLFRLAVSHARRHARRVIVSSEVTRADVVDLLGIADERVAVVPLGPPERFSVPTPEDVASALRACDVRQPYVLFLGEVTHRKNPLALVEAFAAIAGRLPDLSLVVAGPPGLGSAAVRERVERLGLGARVAFPGHVPETALPGLLAGAAVFVLPSKYEGFGIPALEAMSFGTPAVVSDAGSLPEVVGDAGIVVPGADPDGLAAAIERLVSDGAHRADVVARGRARVREFSWERAARRTIEVYEDALAA